MRTGLSGPTRVIVGLLLLSSAVSILSVAPGLRGAALWLRLVSLLLGAAALVVALVRMHRENTPTSRRR